MTPRRLPRGDRRHAVSLCAEHGKRSVPVACFGRWERRNGHSLYQGAAGSNIASELLLYWFHIRILWLKETVSEQMHSHEDASHMMCMSPKCSLITQLHIWSEDARLIYVSRQPSYVEPTSKAYKAPWQRCATHDIYLASNPGQALPIQSGSLSGKCAHQGMSSSL